MIHNGAGIFGAMLSSTNEAAYQYTQEQTVQLTLPNAATQAVGTWLQTQPVLTQMLAMDIGMTFGKDYVNLFVLVNTIIINYEKSMVPQEQLAIGAAGTVASDVTSPYHLTGPQLQFLTIETLNSKNPDGTYVYDEELRGHLKHIKLPTASEYKRAEAQESIANAFNAGFTKVEYLGGLPAVAVPTVAVQAAQFVIGSAIEGVLAVGQGAKQSVLAAAESLRPASARGANVRWDPNQRAYVQG